MFVAITVNNGKPVFCKNPIETTENLEDAFIFSSRDEAEMIVKESKEIYSLNASVLEILEGQMQQEEPQEQKHELMIVKQA